MTRWYKYHWCEACLDWYIASYPTRRAAKQHPHTVGACPRCSDG